MAHYSQRKFVEITTQYLKDNISNYNNLSVLEIGSNDLNGNNKKFFGNNYLGIDIIQGKNVDVVLNGEDISKLNKKFDIIISCEVLEHASNWDNIFQAMINNLTSKGIIIITCASTGRIEHGTRRTNPGEDNANTDYYQNLTKKDFTKKFSLNNIFEAYFFDYNYYSQDLYFLGIKKNFFTPIIFKNYKNEVKKIKNERNEIFYKRLLYSHIMSDKNYQNFRFLRRNIVNFFLKIFKKIK